MIQFYWMKCSAKPSTSITKCNKRLYSLQHMKDEEKCETTNYNLCKTHYKILQKNGSIQRWNGSIMSIDKKTNDILLTNNIELYRRLYLLSFDKYIFCKYKMDEELRIISNGSMANIIERLYKIKAFSSKQEIYNFFRYVPKRELIQKLRFFYGIYYYYSINTEKIIFLQKTIRQKIYFLKHKRSIITVQRFVRHKQWLQSLIVNPKRMRNVFMKNVNKIIKIQKVARKYISTMVSHSCPYTLDNFTDIPDKYRVYYKEKVNNTTHYFFFNVKWLHVDWIQQISVKTFIINPLTKKEFPLHFIEDISKKTWKLTRIEKDYCIDDECSYNTHGIYNIYDDWLVEFKRRSFYSYCMMVLDICFYLDIEIENINTFYQNITDMYFFEFFHNTIPILNDLLRNTPYINLYEKIHKFSIYIKNFLYTSDPNILKYFHYYIVKVLKVSYDNIEEDIYHYIKSIMRHSFKKYIIRENI